MGHIDPNVRVLRMSGIFLSYRRGDSDYAVLLYAWLTERFGSDLVFWDREDIDPGENYEKVLRKRIRAAQVFVALIGPGWTPSLWIRREIGTALQRKRFVLPVFVGGVKELRGNQMHRSIRGILKLERVETSDLRFRSRFMEKLERVVKTASSGTPANALQVGRLTEILKKQTDLLQEDALEQLVSGQIKQAESTLNEVFTLLMALLDLSPGNPEIQVRLGYLFKDLAQTCSPKTQRYKRSVANGFKTFRSLLDGDQRLDRDTRASALNGLGNIYLITEDYALAIDCCRRAVELVPDYTHAWGDLFEGYDGLAARGAIDVVSMSQVLQKIKVTSRGDKGGRFYGPKAIAALDKRLQRWREKATARQNKV
jgi:tetratricopeptide (TPR) repeat protein